MSADTTSSAGSSAKRQLQKATDDLLKLKDEFESILTDHETQKRELARLTTLLFNDVKELRYKNDALATRVDYLEGIVEELDARGAVDAISSRECPEGEDEVKWARSVALCEGPIIKKLVKKTLDHLLGPDVNSSHPQTMPVYDGNADNIPKDPATDTPYLRFNWSDACTAPSNQVAFKRWVDYSQASGRSIFPQATSILSEVLHCHLAERCAAKYAYVRRRLQEHRVLPQSRGAAQAGTAQGDSDRGAATGSGETATGEAATGGVATGEAAAGETAAGNTTVGANTVAAGTGPSATATANKKLQSLFTSRAKGKLRMRERQFEALAPECPWADPKYKSALTETAMSDDEDQPTLPGAKKKYASRPLTWRSDEISLKRSSTS
ncbi:hypothetical protein BOTBODRAFT_198354 [Botryobasidium botryosum FD-172 SS1]|uniref:Uncharacterized protein n=1 Tax=Botryobasidium botryosum (strain FD-172 SS1) TaxID=930990 RepID=A0A067N2X2_BOTB1|nr:hypothetical protein BOTBODRAFT_198354 [Botryobasidium botryosum FD-172 SS1]